MTLTPKQTNAFRLSVKTLIFISTLLFFLYLQFRVQVQNGFTTLYGDSYDAAIVVAIMEHWLSFWQGNAVWSELYYFYPYKNTLAQTDGYFIIGMIYSVIRTFNFDPFISSELSNAFIKCIGFSGFFWMMRKVFNVNFLWAILAAGLFMIANNLTSHGTRVQLATLAFAPIVTTLLWSACNHLLANNGRQLVVTGGAAGILLGAWAITCFYMTWFYIFFTVFFSLILLMVNDRHSTYLFFRAIIAHWVAVTIVAVITGLSFAPLLIIYLPKAAETGFRLYETALHYTVPPIGMLQVGQQNLLFGDLYNKAAKIITSNYSVEGEYYNTGIAPILFVIFIFATVTLFSKNTQLRNKALLRAAGLATLVTWSLIIQINGVSLWYFVFTYFPGAQALNVVTAYQLFLTFPIVTLSLVYLSRMSPRLPVSILLILIGLLILEELNRAYISLDRQAELSKIANIPPAPNTCDVFYVSGWKTQTTMIDKIYAHNVSAMLIAELIKKPTINGFASFNPPDWNLADPNAADYDARVAAYLASHKIVNACKLDLDTKTWRTIGQ